MLQPILSIDLSNVKATMYRMNQTSLPLRLEVMLATTDQGMKEASSLSLLHSGTQHHQIGQL